VVENLGKIESAGIDAYSLTFILVHYCSNSKKYCGCKWVWYLKGKGILRIRLDD
jgi:hypothetical protein